MVDVERDHKDRLRLYEAAGRDEAWPEVLREPVRNTDGPGYGLAVENAGGVVIALPVPIDRVEPTDPSICSGRRPLDLRGRRDVPVFGKDRPALVGHHAATEVKRRDGARHV